jgi:hypothetical protein
MFGMMTPAQWGKLLQIHIDYDLEQFGAQDLMASLLARYENAQASAVAHQLDETLALLTATADSAA